MGSRIIAIDFETLAARTLLLVVVAVVILSDRPYLLLLTNLAVMKLCPSQWSRCTSPSSAARSSAGRVLLSRVSV